MTCSCIVEHKPDNCQNNCCGTKREGVGTSKIRTSKGQNVKSFFKDDQNVERSERQKSEHQKERQKSILSDFQVLMKCQLPMA